MTVAEHGQIDGWCDARLNRPPSAALRFCEHHIGEDFAEYATAYYRSYRAAREEQR